MGKASLKMAFHVTYNGIQDSAVGVHATTRPNIPTAREVVQTYTIPGRDGSLTVRDGTVEDIAVTVEFGFTGYPDEWQGIAASARNWLIGHSGAWLQFSDMPGWHYNVRYVEMSDTARALKKTGTFSATFICDGYQYSNSGASDMTLSSPIANQWATAHPEYLITGNGVCTLTVNGKALQATIAQNLTIDTDRFMAYRTDSGVVMNTALIMGNYEYRDFWLVHGNNTVTISSGFTLDIIPNWRRL